MQGTYRAFSPKTLFAGVVFFGLGFVILALTLIPNSVGYRVIYIIPVLVSPVFLFVGLRFIGKSLRTTFCARCRVELMTKQGAYLREQEPIIQRLIQGGGVERGMQIKFASKGALSCIQVELLFCPACVAVGSISLKQKENKKIVDLLKQTLQGSLVREVRDGLYL